MLNAPLLDGARWAAKNGQAFIRQYTTLFGKGWPQVMRTWRPAKTFDP